MASEPARDPYGCPQAPPRPDAEPADGAPEPAFRAKPDPDVDAPGAAAPAGKHGAKRLVRLAAGLAGAAGRLRAALLPRLDHAVAAAPRVPPVVAAAGAIGVAALVLALLAGDGGVDFPGPALEAQLMSREPAPQTAKASEAPDAAAFVSSPLAERLVEDPAIAPGSPADPQADRREADLFPPPPVAADEGEAGGDSDAVSVLSAAVPRPADPATRLLEQLRAASSKKAAASPPGQAGAERAEPGPAVQLVAVVRREQAVEAWARLQRDNADVLGRLQPIIVEPEPRVSSLFRLRAGPLPSVREAQALCASLSRRAVDCIVVKAGG